MTTCQFMPKDKKRRKRPRYNDIMDKIVNTDNNTKDTRFEYIKSVTGGGNFTKVEHI